MSDRNPDLCVRAVKTGEISIEESYPGKNHACRYTERLNGRVKDMSNNGNQVKKGAERIVQSHRYSEIGGQSLR